MNTRKIGKIVSIKNNIVIGEIYSNIGNYINTLDDTVFVGEIGSYVSIYNFDNVIIGQITSIDVISDIRDEDFNKPVETKKIILNLVGELQKKENDTQKYEFTYGVSKYPLIFSDIYITSKDEEEIIHNSKVKRDLKYIKLGISIMDDKYELKPNINEFFGAHYAILGNTGSGKSNTIAYIIQTLQNQISNQINNENNKNNNKNNSKFIIIDSNGEYANAWSAFNKNHINFKEYEYSNNTNKKIEAKDTNDKKSEDITNNKDNKKDNLIIPVWSLSVEDWATLLNASEKTQLPVLYRSMMFAKIYYLKDDNKNILNNYVLAKVINDLLISSDNPVTKSDKIISLLNNYKTNKINLYIEIDVGIINLDKNKNNNKNKYKLSELFSVHYGKLVYQYSDEATKKLYGFFKQFTDEYLLKKDENKNDEVQYDLQEFKKMLELAALYEGSLISSYIHEKTSSLLIRLDSIIDSEQSNVFKKTDYKSTKDYIKEYLFKYNIVNINLSNLDDISGEVIVKVLSKIILDYLKRNDKASIPVNIVIEEAHRYVKNETQYSGINTNIFERIAKEGRKYGLIMGISTQRPSDLSSTVLSQCSNYIIHRIQNPEDLKYVSKMVPYINEDMISKISYMQTGLALVFGNAINLPMIVSIPKADPTPDSHSADIFGNWFGNIEQDLN